MDQPRGIKAYKPRITTEVMSVVTPAVIPPNNLKSVRTYNLWRIKTLNSSDKREKPYNHTKPVL